VQGDGAHGPVSAVRSRERAGKEPLLSTRLFRNRTWAIELEVVKEGNTRRLGGTLTNLSERLQLMGTNNMMVLKVWFAKVATPLTAATVIVPESVPLAGLFPMASVMLLVAVVTVTTKSLPLEPSAE